MSLGCHCLRVCFRSGPSNVPGRWQLTLLAPSPQTSTAGFSSQFLLGSENIELRVNQGTTLNLNSMGDRTMAVDNEPFMDQSDGKKILWRPGM